MVPDFAKKKQKTPEYKDLSIIIAREKNFVPTSKNYGKFVLHVVYCKENSIIKISDFLCKRSQQVVGKKSMNMSKQKITDLFFRKTFKFQIL